ncbi:MAG TPA: SRPBCC domain-containing protein [Acidimicrobiales bacterium]|nr:SRPBCC domain-containing protein [Acidimicrobiales bacterium]
MSTGHHTAPDAVSTAVEVAVDPATAFRVFTADMGAWYKDTPYSWNDPDRAVGIRIEPGVGGRWIEVWDAATGEGFTMGTITAWEAGRRLVMTYTSRRIPDPVTEIEVRFDPVPGGTRVTLEHRGFRNLPPDTAAEEVAHTRVGEPYLLAWLADHLGRIA